MLFKSPNAGNINKRTRILLEVNLLNVEITGNADPKEAQAYVDYLEEKYGRKLESLDIQLDGTRI